MSVERDWQAATMELIRRLEQDKKLKAEQRVAAAQRALDAVNQQIAVLYSAMEVWRAAYGLPKVPVSNATPEMMAEYQGMSPKEMLLHWADTHDGLVVMREATRFLAAAGLFRDEVQANGTLYPTVTRWDAFMKVGRGIYRSKSSLPPIEDLPDSGGVPSTESPHDDEEGDGPSWWSNINLSGFDQTDEEATPAAENTDADASIEESLKALTFSK